MTTLTSRTMRVTDPKLKTLRAPEEKGRLTAPGRCLTDQGWRTLRTRTRDGWVANCTRKVADS